MNGAGRSQRADKVCVHSDGQINLAGRVPLLCNRIPTASARSTLQLMENGQHGEQTMQTMYEIKIEYKQIFQRVALEQYLTYESL